MIQLGVKMKFNILAKRCVFHWILNVVNSKVPFLEFLKKVACKKKLHFK